MGFKNCWFVIYFVIVQHQSGVAAYDSLNDVSTTVVSSNGPNTDVTTAPNSATTSTTSASFLNVTSNSTLIVKPGAIFAVSQSYLVLYGDSECFCTRHCQEDPRCKHSCWVTYPEIGFCRFTDHNYSDIVQLKRINGFTGFNMPLNIFLGPDDKLYFMADKNMIFEDAVITCKAQENFQVGIYKTSVQLDFLKKTFYDYTKSIWVDLNSISNGPPDAYAVWADGTPFNNTEISLMGLSIIESDEAKATLGAKFRFTGTIFQDRALSADAKFAVLCQERIIPK